MKIIISAPSAMDAKMITPGITPGIEDKTAVSVVSPRKFSKTQRKVNLHPFQLISDTGKVLDFGYLQVDLKTNKLMIEHRNEEFAIEEAN